MARLARDAGRRPQDEAPDGWRRRGRTVKVVDGTTVALPDTPANQRDYPQPRSQKPGVGFPLVRLVVLFTLATGTALDAALGPYRGKQTGESALFRGLHDRLEAGDVLLADRYYCSYFELALVGERGCDAVFRMHQRRRVDFRRGRRLGPWDHVVTWAKPARPEWLAPEEYARLPAVREVREVHVWINRPGYRTRVLVVATTLLDPKAFPWREAAALYGARWYAELDLRAIKDTLQMGVLRGKTPAMARKEGSGPPAGVQPDPLVIGIEFWTTLGIESRTTVAQPLQLAANSAPPAARRKDAYGGRLRGHPAGAPRRPQHREIARQLGVGRDTVRKALNHPEPPPYTQAQPRPAPAFGPFREVVDAILAADERPRPSSGTPPRSSSAASATSTATRAATTRSAAT